MGTLKEKLAYLVTWRKKFTDLINSKTSTSYQTTGSTHPFTGKYSSINMTDVKTNMQYLYPKGTPIPLFMGSYKINTSYTNLTLDSSTTSLSNLPSYPTTTRVDTGLYTLSFTMPNIGSGYYYVYPIITGGYHGTNTDTHLYACIWNTSSSYVSSGSTVSFKIRTADDASANDGGFSIMIFALF